MSPAAYEIRVAMAEGAYSVVISPGLLDDAGAWLKQVCGSTRVAIMTDSNVAPLWLDKLRQHLQAAGIESMAAVLPAGEDHKTLSDLLPVYDTLLRGRMDRNAPVIGLGGGVVTDMAGFVAATILRGVPLVQVPTTLLAMVDASVGGKTGVNHPVGKNLIGAFHQPAVVLIDPRALGSLPIDHIRGGLAECIKHDIIRDAEGFSELEQHIGKALARDEHYLAGLIAHNVAIKARVVESDPFERGERAHLNFGHTFGHAIESVSRYQYSHGQSVGLGMIAASRAAEALGMFDKKARLRIEALIVAAGLPSRMTLDVDAVVDAMAFDKKVSRSKVRFVLPDRIGHVVVRDDVPPHVVRAAVQSLK
jgi:3-dehydroquinate synthase